MLPAANSIVWTQIVTGKRPVKTGKLAINLLVQGNKTSYEKDPSPKNVAELSARTYKFFTQFELAFGSEFAKILA
jgi:hypothetical protein